MNAKCYPETQKSALRVGIGGPVGSGKTALVEALCKQLRDTYDIYVITNDIYTKEDQLILTRAQALAAERIIGVETGRLSAYGYSRGRFHEPRSDRRHEPKIPSRRLMLHRVGRR